MSQCATVFGASAPDRLARLIQQHVFGDRVKIPLEIRLRGGEQTRRSEQERMAAAPKIDACIEIVLHEQVPSADPLRRWGSERLSLRGDGKTAWESYGRQPDSGNPTVRDDKGACGNVSDGSRTEARRETCGIATEPLDGARRHSTRIHTGCLWIAISLYSLPPDVSR
jgi:hypothetical protein